MKPQTRLQRGFRILLITLGSAVAFPAIIMAIWWVIPARTPRINSGSEHSLYRLEFIEIGGMEQCVLIRTENTSNPILLFLHGGPGMPMMYLAHEFQGPLEQEFTVVQWDRRGAGKTYTRNQPGKETMNVRQLLDDAYALIDTLRARYGQDRIILAGHSFGTYLGSILVTEKPELFRAYLSIGQVLDHDRARTLQEAFIREKARTAGRTDIIQVLDQPGEPGLENWLFEFGGELKESKTFFPLIWSGLRAPEYTLREALKVAEGSSFSSENMSYNVLSGSILEEIKTYSVPVYFFTGRWDYTTPGELVAEYHDLISSPAKEIIWFENSAHFPFFEEPRKFCEEILGRIELLK